MRSPIPTCPPLLPTELHGANGVLMTFPSRQAAAAWLGFYALHDGTVGRRVLRLTDEVPANHWGMHVRCVYVVMEGGEVVPPEALIPLLPVRRARWRREAQRPEDYRKAPVPRVGVSFRGIGHMLRSPRTTALLRDAWWQEDGVPPVRARLRGHPTRWDDLWRSDMRDRSWKRHRDHQWKSVN